jgi:crotonobetainyl-CoA:carnitine CoA-transferase CaiB-like acyl-CoA transferase
MLGEHVDNVLSSWLGMDAKHIAALREEGIV